MNVSNWVESRVKVECLSKLLQIKIKSPKVKVKRLALYWELRKSPKSKRKQAGLYWD